MEDDCDCYAFGSYPCRNCQIELEDYYRSEIDRLTGLLRACYPVIHQAYKNGESSYWKLDGTDPKYLRENGDVCYYVRYKEAREVLGFE